MSNRKRGIIFDLDGVIVDTAGFHYLAWKNLANDLGFDFTEEQNEDFKGVSRVRSLELLLEIGGKTATQEEKERWLNSKNEEYLSYINDMTSEDILPGVRKVLDHLIEKNVPMGVGSASKNAVPILKKVSLYETFGTVVDGTDVSKAKPDPEVFEVGAERLGIKKEDTIVFEDAIAGIQAANNAGMTSIGIGDQETLSEADYVFKDFTEISTDFIDQLLNA